MEYGFGYIVVIDPIVYLLKGDYTLRNPLEGCRGDEKTEDYHDDPPSEHASYSLHSKHPYE